MTRKLKLCRLYVSYSQRLVMSNVTRFIDVYIYQIHAPSHPFIFLGAFVTMRKVNNSLVMSVCPSSFRPSLWDTWPPTERIFMKFKI